MVHLCIHWKSTYDARKLTKKLLTEPLEENDVATLSETLLVLNLKSKMIAAWHSTRGSKIDRTNAVGHAIVLFFDTHDISARQLKKWILLLGFCLGNGEFYQDGLRKELRDNKELRVGLKDVKLSKAKQCLVHLF